MNYRTSKSESGLKKQILSFSIHHSTSRIMWIFTFLIVKFRTQKMIQVFRKRYPNLRMSAQGGNEVLIEMDLADTAEFRKTLDIGD